ncbi:MAG: hypothetical protein WDM96_06000 [Lacunisphaera sp.]
MNEKRAIADQVMGAYGLITRFNAVLNAATDQIWKQQKTKLPEDIDDEEQAAIETGIANGVRTKLFAEIEQATRQFAQQKLMEGDAPHPPRRRRRHRPTRARHRPPPPEPQRGGRPREFSAVIAAHLGETIRIPGASSGTFDQATHAELSALSP